MSLANFFDKTALSAASALRNFDRDAFERQLHEQPIQVAFDKVAACTSEGRITLELTANLLARLFPRIGFLAMDSEGQSLRDTLIDEIRKINPAVLIETESSDKSTSIIVGAEPLRSHGGSIYAGSDGWCCKVSTKGPVSCGQTNNPFGAAAAACFAVANVFRLVFASQLQNSGLDQCFDLSLIDLDPTALKPANPSLPSIDIGECCLVGIGAIGNGAAWILRRVANLQGTLHLVDHEVIELTNLQRYVLSDQTNVGRPKVAVVADGWNGGPKIVGHQMRWAEFLNARQDWRISRVTVALDSAQDRCAVQAALPKRIINSWTRAGNIGLSRHSFDGAEACLTCLYLPQERSKSEDQIIAEAIGLPQAAREVREMLYRNVPVGKGWITRISQALGVNEEELMRFESKSMREFYTQAVCGGVILKLGGTRESAVEVPMAFQSALAGICLAAELLIDAADLREKPIATVTQMDLLKPLPPFLSQPALKSASGHCICQDKVYLDVFRRKYR